MYSSAKYLSYMLYAKFRVTSSWVARVRQIAETKNLAGVSRRIDLQP